MPKVVAGHEDNQKELERLAEDLEDCHADLTTNKAAADVKKKDYTDKSTAHKACRALEASLHQTSIDCHVAWTDAKEQMKLKCDAYAAKEASLGEESTNVEIVKKAASLDVETYIE